MSELRFEIRFDEDAYKEYQKLDNSVAQIVDGFLEALEARADEIGKDLVNKQSSKLHGCREIKLAKAGIRIVFRITHEIVDILRIVYVLAIQKRQDDMVFQLASKRLRRFKTSTDPSILLSHTRKWQQSKEGRLNQRDKPHSTRTPANIPE